MKVLLFLVSSFELWLLLLLPQMLALFEDRWWQTFCWSFLTPLVGAILAHLSLELAMLKPRKVPDGSHERL